MLHFHQNGNLVDKPQINLRNIMDRFIWDPLADRFRDHPDPAVVHHCQLLQQSVMIQMAEIIGHEAVHMLLQRTDRFHQTAFKVVADAHDFSGRLHLRSQRSLGADKLIERQTRHLNHTIIQHRLKACHRLSGDRIFDLIQRISDGDLRRHLRDRITGRLGGQRRRTAHSGIHFNDAVFKTLRMKRELNVAAAGNLELCNNVERGSSEHLILFVAQRLRRSHHNTVSRMNSNRIDILHVADRDHIAGAVTHYFILDLFPSRDAAFYQYFSHTGKTQSVCQDFFQFSLVMGDSSAASS